MSLLRRISFALMGLTAFGVVGLLNSAVFLPAFAQDDGQRTFTAYVTGYSYWDNTPPGSADISRPVIHTHAGGKGTYADPITLAVGHSIIGGRDRLDVPAGTRFYLKHLKKYAIVEDTCGDGPRPQNEACHVGYAGHPWFDIYVGGSRSTPAKANACMNRITALQTVIINPPRNLPVLAGALTESGCRTSAG